MHYGTSLRRLCQVYEEKGLVDVCSVKKCNNEGRQQMQLDIDEIWTLLTSIHKIEYGIRSLVMD